MREEEGGERSKERKEEEEALTRGKGEEETRGGKREMVRMIRMGNKMGTDTGSMGGKDGVTMEYREQLEKRRDNSQSLV